MAWGYEEGIRVGLLIGYKAGFSAARHEAWNRIHDALDLADLPDDQILALFRETFPQNQESMPVEPVAQGAEA